MVEYVAQALKLASREATILLYTSALDSHLQKMAELADRVFCFYERSRQETMRRLKRGCRAPPGQPWRHTHEMALAKRGQAY